MMIVNTSQTHSKHKIFFSQSPTIGLGLTRVVLALDAVILDVIWAICIGFTIGSSRCHETRAAGCVLGILKKHDSNDVGRGATRREMRKSKKAPVPPLDTVMKYSHVQREAWWANSHRKPLSGAHRKMHDVRDGRQLNTIHYAIFVRKKLRSTFNQAWICLLHLRYLRLQAKIHLWLGSATRSLFTRGE